MLESLGFASGYYHNLGYYFYIVIPTQSSSKSTFFLPKTTNLSNKELPLSYTWCSLGSDILFGNWAMAEGYNYMGSTSLI